MQCTGVEDVNTQTNTVSYFVSEYILDLAVLFLHAIEKYCFDLFINNKY